MIISNHVRYYKTAKEAIAAVNPSMRKILCPTPGAGEAVEALTKRLGEVRSQTVPVEGQRVMNDILDGLKKHLVNKSEELDLLKTLESCLRHLEKGELGDAIFKLKLKQDKKFAEVLRGVGLQV